LFSSEIFVIACSTLRATSTEEEPTARSTWNATTRSPFT
jgi:hypothetical protein